MALQAGRPEFLEALNERIMADYRHLAVAMNGSWNTQEDKEQARQTLQKTVHDANAAIQSVEGTEDPVLRRLHDALLIQVTLSESAVKNPSALKR